MSNLVLLYFQPLLDYCTKKAKNRLSRFHTSESIRFINRLHTTSPISIVCERMLNYIPLEYKIIIIQTPVFARMIFLTNMIIKRQPLLLLRSTCILTDNVPIIGLTHWHTKIYQICYHWRWLIQIKESTNHNVGINYLNQFPIDDLSGDFLGFNAGVFGDVLYDYLSVFKGWLTLQQQFKTDHIPKYVICLQQCI